MTPTEGTRKRLDELGIKYTIDDSDDYEVIEWRGLYNLWWQFVYDPYDGEPYGELRLLDGGGATNLTPEQAIDVTVGTEPDEATMLKLHDRMNAALLDYESEMGIDGGNGANAVPFVNEMHQIIEDAATVGAGTCRCTVETSNDYYDDYTRYHMECGFTMYSDEIDKPRFCSGCGRRAVTE